MAEAKRIIVGIACDIIDDNTGAPASFHTVSGIHLNLSNQYYTVTLDSYFMKPRAINIPTSAR